MKIVDFIVCDDIRQEVGGKLILIGLYDEINIHADNIKNFSFPFHIKKLCFLIRMVCADQNGSVLEQADQLSVDVCFEGETIGTINAELKGAIGKKFLNFFFAIEPFTVKGEGNISLKVTFLKGSESIVALFPENPCRVNIKKTDK